MHVVRLLRRVAASALVTCFVAPAALAAPPTGSTFDFPDTRGKQHRLADYKGKWVVINFWATWCAPCIKEMPDFQAYWKERGPDGRDDVRVIGVATDSEDAQRIDRFVAKLGVEYPQALGTDRIEKQFGRIRGMPTTYIYDPRGKLVTRREGPMEKHELEALTRAR